MNKKVKHINIWSKRMKKVILTPIMNYEDKNAFVREVQEAFQNSYVAEFGPFEKKFFQKKI